MYKDKQFVVVGLGRFGQAIVETLCEANCEVLAIDVDGSIVREVSNIATHVIQVDATDESAMSTLGLSNFDIGIVAIGTDFEATIMATMIVKELGVSYVIAKAQDSRQEKILKSVGADRVVLPEMEMGIKLATTLTTTNVIEFINLSKQYGIAEIAPIEEWFGKTLQKANIRATYGINIVAIKRANKIIVTLQADDIIESDDILVVIGENADITRVSRKH